MIERGYQNRTRPKAAMFTLAFSITAMILYIPANIFPFMTIELYGHRNSSTIFGGVLSLLDTGSPGLALLIFLASILIPAAKLAALFFLSLSHQDSRFRHLNRYLYRGIELIGRWSMLDIFLLAVMVAVLKLGHLANVQPEVGSGLFAGVVVFTMLASASFDPKRIGEGQNDNDLEKS